MFPWMMPNLSLLSLMYPQATRPNPFDDRADQSARGNQPDRGNAMAPPGQNPPGGPDNNPQSGYDYNTVSPGWGAPNWMQMLGGGNRNQRRDPRAGMQMGLLGLSMLQPRQPNTPRPYPWI